MYGNGWIIFGLLVVMLLGCSNQYKEVLESAEIKRSSCAQEAVQLINTVRCFAQQIENTSNFIVLEAGRFVYLCREDNAWVGVMYPRTGEAVDCNFRSANQQCPTGWVKDELVIRSFD